jgi:hypothetical protein
MNDNKRCTNINLSVRLSECNFNVAVVPKC